MVFVCFVFFFCLSLNQFTPFFSATCVFVDFSIFEKYVLEIFFPFTSCILPFMFFSKLFYYMEIHIFCMLIVFRYFVENFPFFFYIVSGS
jgi:hypothetical protein